MRSASAWTWSASPREERHEPQHRAAILTGGCFWGVQDLLRHRDGVIPTRVGYTGGKDDNPTYGNHPGHAEAVEIVFDPERISYFAVPVSCAQPRSIWSPRWPAVAAGAGSIVRRLEYGAAATS
jgi:hypothetical protein